ncbi:MAG: leucine-rich repeat protein [Bacteroides sp.]|nr:leucine-rich repeat protein [Bacteroides sp.]
MRNLFLLFGFILISLWANAAKPEQVDTIIDHISYTLDIANQTALLVSGNDCSGAINIPSSIEYKNMQFDVNEIEYNAFKNNSDITSVIIPSSVSSIGHQAFFCCWNLEEVVMEYSNITTIAYAVFSNCYKLKTIRLPNTVKEIGQSAFNSCEALYSIYLPNSIERIYMYAFNECKNLKEVHIEDISNWCQVYEEGLYSNPFLFSDGDLYVGENLVEDLIIPSGVISIGNQKFIRCGSIKSVEFSKSIEYIDGFAACQNLKSINIYSSADISYTAFNKCPQLEIVNCYVSEPPTLQNTIYNTNGEEVNAFYQSYPELMTLHVPQGAKKIYEGSYGWKDFGTIIDDLPNDSGVDEVTINESKPIEIFNLNGVSVFYGIGDYKLPGGIYIIRQGWKSKKIVIK